MIASFIVGLVIGVVAGLLISRKHRAKLDGVEAKGRTILDVIKGR